MAQHTRYWTCSKFADWLRGTKKPGAATWEDWETWHENAKKAHPVRYWLADDCLDFLQDFVTYPTRKLHDLKYYVNNRWVTRTHSLTASPIDIKPGQWRDVGNRFLPCLFNELQDFVEVELAWWHIAWNSEDRAKYEAPFWATGWFRWRTWRCPQAGLDNLDWQRKLTLGKDHGVNADDPDFDKPTQQAVKAQEIYDLYIWWTQTYRNRPDAWEASGYRAVTDKEKEENGGRLSFTERKNSPLKKERDRARKLMTKIENSYEREDEAMMIRLIKIRQSLWT
jgi:hypothetical protein